MRRSLSNCPICTESLEVSELACRCCHTQIRGHFDRCNFCSLTNEQSQFIALFLQHRGNLTSVAAELSLSPPTVARRLDAIQSTLGLREPDLPLRRPEEREADRRKILEQLDSGDISADEATRLLRDL